MSLSRYISISPTIHRQIKCEIVRPGGAIEFSGPQQLAVVRIFCRDEVGIGTFGRSPVARHVNISGKIRSRGRDNAVGGTEDRDNIRPLRRAVRADLEHSILPW